MVEEKVLELQNSKRELADAIINAEQSNTYSRLSFVVWRGALPISEKLMLRIR
jgi:hypothetical protein